MGQSLAAKPHIWPSTFGGRWLCTVMRARSVGDPIGKGDTPALAFIDWRAKVRGRRAPCRDLRDITTRVL